MLDTFRSRLILYRGSACVPYLLRALHDDSRYVAAHVYLTFLTPGSHPVSGEGFNNLLVDFVEDQVVIPPNQKERLIEQWRSTYK